jgi:hypothetical protein
MQQPGIPASGEAETVKFQWSTLLTAFFLYTNLTVFRRAAYTATCPARKKQTSFFLQEPFLYARMCNEGKNGKAGMTVRR